MAKGIDNVVVAPLRSNVLPGARWQPNVGPEARGVIDRKNLDLIAGDAIIESASSILARGAAPGEHQIERTGLVVGHVQSGKTLSFTTVIAMARDNGYRLVITLGGTSNPLLNQSTGRLRNDLFVDDVAGYLRWITFKNPTDSDNIRRSIQQILDEWRDDLVPDSECPTVLITVMKHHGHLKNLVALLGRLDLDDVPTLIVDDEADQASLNTLVNRSKTSTTYVRLLELRDAVPVHTFLQYTATPQAPLLINIIDSLSPEFVEVLQPGANYVGGDDFFLGTSKLTRAIPVEDVPTKDNIVTAPPPSLLDALRIFLVGVAVGLISGRSPSNVNRSMLVHPSRTVAEHREYHDWIGHIFDEWQSVLSLPASDPDRVDLMEDFHDAYVDLCSTVADMPKYDDVARMLRRAFRLTSIEEVNARGGRTPTIDWKRSYGWILVGGQAMDRGFTVEGLTVTYMPRGPGVGNADTIQQRGRFFGYKRQYLGFCRAFLEEEVHNSFKQYVEHEDEMRFQLQEVRNSGGSLKEWKRAFVLSPALKPCRTNVIFHGYARGSYADEWFIPRVVLEAESVIKDNRMIVESFLGGLSLEPDVGSADRQPAQIHQVAAGVHLETVVNALLAPYRVTSPRDSRENTGVLLQLAHALDQNSNEKCTVYRMSPKFKRQRSVDQNGDISNLFQGAAPVFPQHLRGSIYPGDREIRESEDVTVQLHFVDLLQNKNVVAEGVPIVAIWIPRRLDLSWIVQEQE